MKNIIKMRIIRGRMNKAEAEYLLEFFKYIGLITYDDAVDEFYPNSWNNRLEIVNDSDGVDVVLNCFDKNDYSYSSELPNRIYLYFSFEHRYCIVSDVPLSKVEVLSQSITEDKRELRSNALNRLINKIWEGDEENRKAIQYILNCYVSVSEDRDLFYILQAKRCCDILRSREAVQGATEKAKKELRRKYKDFKMSENEILKKLTSEIIEEHLPLLSINEYVEKMFKELWRMQCLLKDDNPYTVFARSNTTILLYELYKLISPVMDDMILAKIEFEGKKIEFKYPYELISELQVFFREEKRCFYSIISLLFIKIYNLTNNNIRYNDELPYLNHLTESSKNSNIPAYYSDAFFEKAMYILAVGKKNNDKNYRQLAIKNFQKSLKCNPQNSRANYELGLLFAINKKFDDALGYLTKIPYDNFWTYFLDKKSKYFFQVSLEEFICLYETRMLMIQICLNKRSSENGVLSNINLISDYILEDFGFNRLMYMVSNPFEKSYLEFMKHHEYSAYLFYLLSWYEPICRDIGSSKYAKDKVREKLSKWGQ